MQKGATCCPDLLNMRRRDILNRTVDHGAGPTANRFATAIG
jgi:hypothetical protein